MISRLRFDNFSKILVWFSLVVIGLWMVSLTFPDEASALIFTVVCSGVALSLFRHFSEEKEFITTLFLAALGARLAFGLFIHAFDLQGWFGGDAFTYDGLGALIADNWSGLVPSDNVYYQMATSTNRPGWGMHYVVAGIYYITGRNMLAAQSFCAVIGAATAPMVYHCANKVFANKNVAKNTALAIAFFPAFVIWSAQLLKDGIIVFLLVLAFTMVLQLQERISYASIVVLVLSLFGIITLRFYIFYMVAIAVAGSFIIGASQNSTSIFRRAAVLLLIGFGLTYLGITRNASVDFTRYADLEKVQVSRLDLARSADSGFGEEVDVSTTGGAISAIPIGFAYLMFAPFPWQAATLRQAIALPEVFLWWAMIPLVIYGIVYAFKHRLRSTFPILFFSLVLTLAYSIFQGNVGTAYRQRTQIQVFLFIFAAVGWELFKEKREDKKMERLMQRRRLDERLQAGAGVHQL